MRDDNVQTSITFRDFRDSDKAQIYEWISDAFLRKMIGTRGEITREGHDRWFDIKCTDNVNLNLIIEAGGIPIGIAGTNHMDYEHQSAELYWYIGESEYRGRGLGKKALRDFSVLLFNENNIHKITAKVFTFNSASIRTLESVGFRLEDVQKQQENQDGTYIDLLIYSMIREKQGETP